MRQLRKLHWQQQKVDHYTSNMTKNKIGVLILNLGTPNSPSVKDVRVYLREFLNDPRVIDIGRIAQLLLVNLINLSYPNGSISVPIKKTSILILEN